MKEMTYAERQYRIACSMIREADKWVDTEREHSSDIWNDMLMTVEESYVDAAIMSSRMSYKKNRYGVNWWNDQKLRRNRNVGMIAEAIAINEHIRRYFQPF